MPPRARVSYPSVDQRRAQGQEALNRTPLSSHFLWIVGQVKSGYSRFRFLPLRSTVMLRKYNTGRPA